MSGYCALLMSCSRLDSALDRCVVGAVRAGGAPSIMDKCATLIKQINLVNSKKILLRAAMTKDSFVDPEEMDDEEAAMNQLTKSIDVRVRWSRALRAQSMSKAAIDIHREQNPEHLHDIESKLKQMTRNHLMQDQLDQEMEAAFKELSAARLRYRKVAAEYSKIRTENIAKNRAPKPHVSEDDARMDLKMGELLKKIEIMLNIQRKLMASCSTYDWCKDPAKLTERLPELRKPPPTLESLM